MPGDATVPDQARPRRRRRYPPGSGPVPGLRRSTSSHRRSPAGHPRSATRGAPPKTEGRPSARSCAASSALSAGWSAASACSSDPSASCWASSRAAPDRASPGGGPGEGLAYRRHRPRHHRDSWSSIVYTVLLIVAPSSATIANCFDDAPRPGADRPGLTPPCARAQSAPATRPGADRVGRDRRLGVGQVDHELGEVGGEHVLADSSTGSPVDRPGDALAPQHRRARRAPRAARRRAADAAAAPIVWVAPPSGDAEQLVERRRARRRPATARRRTRSGHHTVTRANGSPSARLSRRTRSTVSHPSTWRTRGGAFTNRKSRTRRSRLTPSAASWLSMVPSRPSVWRSGSAATNHPKPWRESTRPSSRSTSSARRTVTRLAAYALGQLGLAGQQPPGAELARLGDPARELVGDRSGSGSARTCPILVYTRAPAAGKPCAGRPPPASAHPIVGAAPAADSSEESPWPSPPTPRSSSSTRVYGRLAERVAIGRERLGRPLTFAEKILINHLRDPAEPASSSGAAATPTSTPTASPCRTPPPRWRCCSS